MNTSERLLRASRLVLLVIALPALTMTLVGYVLHRAATHWEERSYPLPPISTAVGQLPGTPAAPYPAINPALLGAMALARPNTKADPFAMLILDMPPLDYYQPSTGDMQFALPTPTGTPALAPLPTVTLTVTPTHTVTGSPTPSATPPPTLTPAKLYESPCPTQPPAVSYYAAQPPDAPSYGGLNCAPAGWPVAGGALTQYFHAYHPAIDIGIPLYTPVVATHSGMIKFAGWSVEGYGNLIIVENGSFVTYYAHLSDFNVTSGQLVERGALIGWSGSTGNSTGPHIHYEIHVNGRPVDPLTFEQLGYPPC